MPNKFKLLDKLLSQQYSLPYQTNLSPQEQLEFSDWATKNEVPLDLSPRSDYDMPGFYKAMQSGDPLAQRTISPMDKRIHFTDKFKTPYHETFSKESIYADKTAPSWYGNALRSSSGELEALELPEGKILRTLKGIKR